MAENKVGTREEWETARAELAKLEAEQAERNKEIKQRRLELPWVPVEKEYVFDTEDGRKTLAELFDGRSQLLAYNIMFGPDYELGACPGCRARDSTRSIKVGSAQCRSSSTTSSGRRRATASRKRRAAQKISAASDRPWSPGPKARCRRR